MSIKSALTVNQILKRVAVEVGLGVEPDPFASEDPNYIQMLELLHIAGEELAIMYDWNILISRGLIDTRLDTKGVYNLPDDFLRLTNQTAWDHFKGRPVPLLSAQDVHSRPLADLPLSFQLTDGVVALYPQPVSDDLRVSYGYISSYWVVPANVVDTKEFNNFLTSRGLQLFTSADSAFRVYDGTAKNISNTIDTGNDVAVYDRTLITRYLKLKWLQAKGFDSTTAQADFDQIFELLSGVDKGSKVLSINGNLRGVPLLNTVHNLAGTGYGI